MLTQGILLTLTTGVVWCMVAIVYSRATQKTEGFYSFMAISSLCFALTVWTAAPPAAIPAAAITIAAVILPAGILGQLGFWALCGAMRRGSHSVSWAIAQAAMLCPFAAGLICFGEPATPARLAGMGILVVSLLPLALSRSAAATGGKPQTFPGFAFAAFALIGAQQVLTLIPNHLPGLPAAALTWRVPLLSLCGLGWFAAGYGWSWRKVWLSAVLYGILVAAGQWTLFCALDHLSAAGATAIAYPLAVGSSIILFFVYSQWFRKEKTGLFGVAGISLAALGIILLAF